MADARFEAMGGDPDCFGKTGRTLQSRGEPECALLPYIAPREHADARRVTPQRDLDGMQCAARSIGLRTQLHEAAAGIDRARIITVDQRKTVVVQWIIRDPDHDVRPGVDLPRGTQRRRRSVCVQLPGRIVRAPRPIDGYGAEFIDAARDVSAIQQVSRLPHVEW